VHSAPRMIETGIKRHATTARIAFMVLSCT
jgi:hypothetical protein